MSKPRVAIKRCAISASQEEVDSAVAEAVAAIGGIPQAVRNAKSMMVKPNYVGVMSRASNDDVRMHKGRHAHNTEPAVCAAAVKLIREANPSATIYYGDGLDTRHAHRTKEDIFDFMGATALAREYDLTLLDCNEGEFVQAPVPDGVMMRYLWVRREIAEADTYVSLAKLKCHQTAGITLSMKNMFGLLPRAHYGAENRGFMHQNAHRLMRVFVTVNQAFPLSFQVIDGIVGTNHGMSGEPKEAGLVIAGANSIATDAVGMQVMGFDPQADFGTPPFFIAENHIKLAAAAGLGTTQLDQIEVLGETPESFGLQFETRPESEFTHAKAAAILAATRAQARVYLEMRDELLKTHSGKFVFLVDGEVVQSVDTIAEAAKLDYFGNAHGFGFATQVLPPSEAAENIEAYLA